MTELLGFTAEHVSRLTGLTKGQLAYWDKTEFFSPALTEPRRTYSRVYSFRDLVGLRVIATLRINYSLPLQELRRVGQWLHERFDEPWSKLRFGLSGDTVIFLDPDSGHHTEAKGQGQQVLKVVCIEEIANEMRKAARSLQDRADRVGKIEKRRQVASSAYVIAGTRVHTQAIWNFHQAGFDTEAIISEYPQLKPADIAAAIKFEEDRHRAA